MLSQPCHLAQHQGIAMTLEGKQQLHAKCGGLCVYIDQTHKCECPCHDEHSDLQRGVMSKRVGPLPLAVVAVSAPDPVPADKDRPRRSRAGNGRCECGCGSATGGRFAPGHDAKLKGKLWASAKLGGFKDWAEIYLRGWAKNFDTAKLPFEVEAKGEAFARAHPDLVERRTEYRQRNAPDTPST